MYVFSPPSSAELLVITPLTGRDGLRVVGEIDSFTAGRLDAALSALGTPQDDVHLELDGLRFIDSQGAHSLVQFAAGLAGGRRLVVHHAPSILCRMLALLWPNAVGLELVSQAPIVLPDARSGDRDRRPVR